MVTMTPDRLRQLRRIGLFAGFGLVVFIIALYMSFPYDRAKDAAIRMASKNLDIDVEIGSAGPAFGWRSCSGTSACARAPRRASRPASRSIRRSSRLRSWRCSRRRSRSRSRWTRWAARSSSISRARRARRAASAPSSPARDIDLAEIPGVKEAINMPLTGKLKLELEIASETGRYADANGFITITCAECVAGDGKTPLKVAGNAFLSGGLTLPRTRIGDLGGRVAVEKGTAKLQGVESKSPDGEVGAGGRDRPPRSAVVVDREPLPSFQAVRRVPAEGEQPPDDPAGGGRGGEAPGRFLRPSHRRAPRPDDAARADADLAGGEQRGAPARRRRRPAARSRPRRRRSAAVRRRPLRRPPRRPPRRRRRRHPAAAAAAARGGGRPPPRPVSRGGNRRRRRLEGRAARSRRPPKARRAAPAPEAPPPRRLRPHRPRSSRPGPGPIAPATGSEAVALHLLAEGRAGDVEGARGAPPAAIVPAQRPAETGAGSPRTCARRGGWRRRAAAARRAARSPASGSRSLPSARRNADGGAAPARRRRCGRRRAARSGSRRAGWCCAARARCRGRPPSPAPPARTHRGAAPRSRRRSRAESAPPAAGYRRGARAAAASARRTRPADSRGRRGSSAG